MKAQPFNLSLRLTVLAVIFCGAMTLYSGTPSTNTPAAKTTSTNTPAVTNAIPLSVFDVNLASGRDPFFPRSGRRAITVTAATETTATTDPASLTLHGLSHDAKRPMATINNQTFLAGEEGEVVTSTGRLRIRCEEIKVDSVIISIGSSQRLELRLPQRY
jgi:hypothetical protein